MKHRIIFETGLQPKPEPHEISAAVILAEYFASDVTFLRRGIDSTADFVIKNVVWELKSPRGNSKHTIQNNLRDAGAQSINVIVDLGRSKMSTEQAISKIRYFLANGNRHIKKLLLITRSGEVIDIYQKMK